MRSGRSRAQCSCSATTARPSGASILRGTSSGVVACCTGSVPMLLASGESRILARMSCSGITLRAKCGRSCSRQMYCRGAQRPPSWRCTRRTGSDGTGSPARFGSGGGQKRVSGHIPRPWLDPAVHGGRHPLPGKGTASLSVSRPWPIWLTRDLTHRSMQSLVAVQPARIPAAYNESIRPCGTFSPVRLKPTHGPDAVSL